MGWSRITKHVESVCACSSVDRVPGYEPVGRRFESCQARHRRSKVRFAPAFFYYRPPILLHPKDWLVFRLACIHSLARAWQTPGQTMPRRFWDDTP